MDYKGLSIFDGTPVGEGGQALNNNFTAIADIIGLKEIIFILNGLLIENTDITNHRLLTQNGIFNKINAILDIAPSSESLILQINLHSGTTESQVCQITFGIGETVVTLNTFDTVAFSEGDYLSIDIVQSDLVASDAIITLTVEYEI